MPLASVSVLPHPMGFEDKVLVRFSRTNPLQAAKPYPGPQLAIDLTGGNIRALIGYRADGSPVWWTLFEADWGMRGGAVFGDTGSGKSVLLRSLITSFAYTGLVMPVVGCPQGGGSYPMWIKHAPWPAPSGDEILHQARGLLAAHRRRSAINRLLRRDLHVPTRDAPLLPWIVDELHKMREHPDQDEFYAIVDIVEREGRKTGIRMVIADQDPSVPNTFNNLNSIRSSLIGAGGQCVILRISKNVGAQLPGGLVDPRTIPTKFPDGTPTTGLAVLNGEPELFRVANLLNADALAAAAPTLEPEPAIVGVMGDHYGKRHTRRAEEDGQLAVQIAQDDPELYAQLVRNDPALAAAAQAAAEAARHAAYAAQAEQVDGPSARGRVVVTRVPVPPVPAIKRITWTCEQRVLQVVRRGVTKFGDIKAEATKPDRSEYSETALRDAIASLAKQGLVDASQWGRVLPVDPSGPAEGKRTA
jgi:preprotein translocase subunit Sss1